jgi:hypothetical protein
MCAILMNQTNRGSNSFEESGMDHFPAAGLTG